MYIVQSWLLFCNINERNLTIVTFLCSTNINFNITINFNKCVNLECEKAEMYIHKYSLKINFPLFSCFLFVPFVVFHPWKWIKNEKMKNLFLLMNFIWIGHLQDSECFFSLKMLKGFRIVGNKKLLLLFMAFVWNITGKKFSCGIGGLVWS